MRLVMGISTAKMEEDCNLPSWVVDFSIASGGGQETEEDGFSD
jgi:hypothetical protein